MNPLSPCLYITQLSLMAIQQFLRAGRGGDQVVSVLAFYSDDPNLNPAEAYKKRPGLANLKKTVEGC